MFRPQIGSFFLLCTLIACSHTPQPENAPSAARPEERGEYLVKILGCNECHTPSTVGQDGKRDYDLSKLLSGHPETAKVLKPEKLTRSGFNWVQCETNTAFAGEWGITYSTNLTPDEETGIGKWTEELFIQVFRTGKHHDSTRPIMPPMPWGSLSKLSDEDLKAIYAYLRAVPPIHNRAPDYEAPAD